MQLRIAGITDESVVDGPGIRMVIFTQGCPHHCPGCHNPETHDPHGGSLVDTDKLLAIVRQAKRKLVRGVTFSGGEPFLQAAPLVALAKAVKQEGLDVVTYSGYYLEQLLVLAARHRDIRDLLAQTDLLVDGPYIAAERDLRLAFRGSRNQRLIDMPASLAAGRPVLWRDKAAAVWV